MLQVVISALLLILSFPPFDVEPLAWIALVPFFSSIKGKSRKEAFLMGLLWGLIFFTGILYWIAYAVKTYGGLSLPVSLFITFLLIFYLSLYPALFALLLPMEGRTRPLFAAPLYWASLEYLRGILFTGFPWALLGYSQYRSLHLVQIADITGVYGISFFLVALNVSLFLAVVEKEYLRGLIAVLLLSIPVLTYGHVRLKDIRLEMKRWRPLKVGIVQGNIPQDIKWDEAYRSETVRIYREETLKLLSQSPSLVVWPETALPFYLQIDEVYGPEVVSLVKKGHFMLLTGSPAFEVTEEGLRYYNSAFLLGKGGIEGRYDKIHLVPFGEYVPLKRILFFARKLVVGAGEFSPGEGVVVLGERGEGFGVVICYEAIFPDLFRRFVKEGATFMVNITNDAWYGRTSAPYQHFSQVVLRAIENRVFVVRSANTGISGVIGPDGNILHETRIFERTSFSANIGLREISPTFYTRYGDLFAWLNILFSLSLIFVIKKRLIN